MVRTRKTNCEPLDADLTGMKEVTDVNRFLGTPIFAKDEMIFLNSLKQLCF